MPCAIDEIRKLGRAGHQVIAADTFANAPGNHSKYANTAMVVPSPRHATKSFIEEIARIVKEENVDLILPGFEEVFYLAKNKACLPQDKCFFPDFDTLFQLHHKGKLLDLAREIGVRVPHSIVATSQAELRDAVAAFPRYFAKPVFSRGGVHLLTNTGPLAGHKKVEDFEPSEELPWLVQEYVTGVDVCSFSVVHHGKITAHSTYEHPREIEKAGGIVFESVNEPECLSMAQRFAEATGYHGQMSFDYKRTEQGMVLIECNPRPTAGIHVMPDDMFVQGLLDTSGSQMRVAEPGIRRKYSFALVRDMILHWREAHEDIKYLLSDAKEVVADPDDLGPALYQVLSYGQVAAYKKQSKENVDANHQLMAAYFYDVCWNGEPIDVVDLAA